MSLGAEMATSGAQQITGDAELREEIEQFLRNDYLDELRELWEKYPKEKRDVWIDVSDVNRMDPNIRDAIVGYVNGITYGDVRSAFETIVCDLDAPVDINLDPERVSVRFYNLGTSCTYPVGGYWADEQLGQYISITGQIAKSTKVRPRYTVISYECLRCGSLTSVPQHPTDTEDKPSQCSGCERKGPFRKDEERSTAVNHQMLLIEQPAHELDPTDDPDQLPIQVEGDLVRHLGEHDVTGGSRVTVSGILGTGTDLSASGASEWLLDAHAVEVDDSDFDPELISPNERKYIHELATGEHGDPLELVAGSIAPGLKGHETIEDVTYGGEERTKLFWVKAFCGLASLFQGWRREEHDGTSYRGTSHTLLIGDPSTGKSTIMNSIRSISPRSASTSGKGVSAAGLTAAAVQKNDFGRTEWQLEAGVLVKAHRGVAVIDELDKIPSDVVDSMHRALEQQVVEVSKAGIHASLPCETALVAAANPKDSRFNGVDPISDQIDMVDSLLDRFDLIFTLKDTPSRDRDKTLATHVIGSRNESGLRALGVLDDDEGETTVAVEHEILTKWITLARECNPVIHDDDVIETIRDFYVEIRDSNDSSAIPATARSLSGILRLAEASARMRLSEEITTYDASVALAGFKASLQDVGFDPTSGEYDIDRLGGVAKAERDLRKQVATVIENRDGCATTAELADALGWSDSQEENNMRKLRNAGVIYWHDKSEGWRVV